MADRDAIVRVALDYFGWFDGDAAREQDAPSVASDPRTTLLPRGTGEANGAGDDRGLARRGSGGRETFPIAASRSRSSTCIARSRT